MREQQVVTTARSVPVRQRLTPVTGTFWFPRASAESDVLSAAGPPSAALLGMETLRNPGWQRSSGSASPRAQHAGKADQESVLSSPVRQQHRSRACQRASSRCLPLPAAPSAGLAWRRDSQSGSPCCLFHVGFSEREDGGNCGAGSEGCV